MGVDQILNGRAVEVQSATVKDLLDAGAVETGVVRTTPIGVRLDQDSNQSIADNTITTVSWDSADEYNSKEPAFADTSNDRVTIPSGDYTRVHVTCQVEWTSNPVAYDIFDLRVNGSNASPEAQIFALDTAQSMQLKSAWMPISSGDDLTIRLRQVSGSSQETNSDGTWFEAVVV